MERQWQSSLSQIHPGHLRRYEFAASRVWGRVLDAACGCGYGSKILSDAGCEVTGMDIDQKTIDFARKNYPTPLYIVGDARQPLEVDFDWVVSFETIEHIEHPEKALDAFHCAQNLILSSPNSDHYPFIPENYKDDDYPHLRHYSPKELEDLLASCGWEVVERYGQFRKHKQVDERQGPFQIVVCKSASI